MRHLLIAFTLAGLFHRNCIAQADSMDGRKHYCIKSCRIVLGFVNGPQSGLKTIIFDDWGNKEKEEVVTTTDTATMRKVLASIRDGVGQSDAPAFLNNIPLAAKQHILTIKLQGQRYVINLDRHVGAKGPFLLLGGSFEENMKQMRFAFVRLDTLLGKPCKVWEQPGGFRMWVWNNYVVKKQIIQDFPAGMRIEEYPIKIDELYSIEADEFKIPDDIQWQ
jgi:hypothetical protein